MGDALALVLADALRRLPVAAVLADNDGKGFGIRPVFDQQVEAAAEGRAGKTHNEGRGKRAGASKRRRTPRIPQISPPLRFPHASLPQLTSQ
jgi:hypothetical protein